MYGECFKYEQNAMFLLVGNKSDWDDLREVKWEEAEKFSKERNIRYVECSASKNINILEIFNGLVLNILKKIQEKED